MGNGVLSKASAEDIARSEENARAAVQNILQAYERNLPDARKKIEPLARKANQIADETLQAERDKALEFLGLDPQADTGVFIFLSWSMPLELMRAYVLDAMWSGATVHFRGVPPGRELVDFITKDLRSLVYGKNAANISIDPRMFDAFSVTDVPTIVFSTSRDQFSCKGWTQKQFKSGDATLSYDACPPLSEDKYWKVRGAVSVSYALAEFKAAGAPGVQPYVDAISKGYAQGVPPGKEQKAFEGNWEDILSPEELEMARKFDEAYKNRSSEPERKN